MKYRSTLTVALIAALSLGYSGKSDASIILLFSQSGDDVILAATGSLSLEGLARTDLGASLGATNLLDTTNEQLQIGSGTSAGVNRFTLSIINTPFNSSTNIIGSVDSWDSNSNSIRFQQNNGFLLIDNAFETGDTLTVNSQITFPSRVLADFGLTAGTSVVFLENENATANNQVIVSAIPEPSTTILIGLGGLALVLRRRKSVM